MTLSLSKTHNLNYLAKVVQITSFKKHPNADRMKLAAIGGFTTAVDIHTEPGIYIYFPVECQISDWYLKANNQYRDKTLNANPEVRPGYFEERGRVRCLKLRDFTSEG